MVSSIPRPQLLTELRADRPDENRLVRGFLALLAFCFSFWAAAVSGAAVAANPRRRATARREGARAHSYASRGAAASDLKMHTVVNYGPYLNGIFI